jgi:hypothetical protein
MRLRERSTRAWATLSGGVALTIGCSLLALHLAAIHTSLSAGLYVALGSATLLAGIVFLVLTVRGHYPSRAARVALILGPVVGCVSGGLGLIALGTWGDWSAALGLFAVTIICFQVAGIFAIFLRVRRRPRQRASPVQE